MVGRGAHSVVPDVNALVTTLALCSSSDSFQHALRFVLQSLAASPAMRASAARTSVLPSLAVALEQAAVRGWFGNVALQTVLGAIGLRAHPFGALDD